MGTGRAGLVSLGIPRHLDGLLKSPKRVSNPYLDTPPHHRVCVSKLLDGKKHFTTRMRFFQGSTEMARSSTSEAAISQAVVWQGLEEVFNIEERRNLGL